jgi:CRP-like cAMP-binding protein
MSTKAGGSSKGAAKGQGSSPSDLQRLLAQMDISLFKGLPKRHLRRIARLAELKQYLGTVPIVRAGTPGDAFHIIIDGSAEVRAVDGSTGTLRPGDYFGELALLDGAPRAATVTALGELTTARIARRDFARLVDEEPGITVGLIKGLVVIVREAQQGSSAASRPAGPSRVLDIAPRGGETPLAGKTALGWLSALAAVPLFRELRGRHLTRVIRLAELRRYGAGVAVVRAGSPGDAFHVVLDGRARAQTPEGHVSALQAGDFFGELALLDGAPRAATVVAVDDLTTARIGRPAFLKLIREEPAIAAGVLRGLVRIVRDVEAGATPASTG